MVVQALCFNWSMYYLPLPIAFTINVSSPLFVGIWDWLLYGVKLNYRQICWLMIAFFGVVLTVNG
jgi:drug/metabolite transporter (DMT)-like permease